MDERLAAIAELLETVEVLRGPEGCRWDREQTLESLRPYMLEEAHEVAEAAESEDWPALSEELGDLLLHILMWSEIGSEKGIFTMKDIAGGVQQKLIRRHPHVFTRVSELSSAEVEKQWEAIKRGEREESHVLSAVPRGIPSLQAAWRITGKAADSGLEPYPDESDIQAMTTAFLESGSEDALGDLLLVLAGHAGSLGLEPELALKRANKRFMMKLGACLDVDQC